MAIAREIIIMNDIIQDQPETSVKTEGKGIENETTGYILKA